MTTDDATGLALRNETEAYLHGYPRALLDAERLLLRWMRWHLTRRPAPPAPARAIISDLLNTRGTPHREEWMPGEAGDMGYAMALDAHKNAELFLARLAQPPAEKEKP